MGIISDVDSFRQRVIRQTIPTILEVNGVTGYAIGLSDWFFSQDGMSAIEVIHTRSGDFKFKLYEVNDERTGLVTRVDCPDYWWTRSDALQAGRSATSARF